jgi:hypothetical protein
MTAGVEAFHEYLYQRDNPAGEHQELWYHEQGDRSWLVVTRNTVTHEITKVELARDVARARGRSEMTQSHRIEGGQIDRTKTLRFTFDGIPYQGHPGDTLASALLANGVRLMGRSFKYHRPRGPISSGSEEPNAIVELRTGGRQEPNTRATVAELFDGLDGPQPEPLAVPPLRRDGDQRQAVDLLRGRVLLQDLHVAQVLLGKAL